MPVSVGVVDPEPVLLPLTPGVELAVGVRVAGAVPLAVTEDEAGLEGVTEREAVRVLLPVMDIVKVCDGVLEAVPEKEVLPVGERLAERVGEAVVVEESEGQIDGPAPPVLLPYTFNDTVTLSQVLEPPGEMATCSAGQASGAWAYMSQTKPRTYQSTEP